MLELILIEKNSFEICLIKIFTDEYDVVIDPVAGSGTTLYAATMCNRISYGFEIKKNYFKEANEKLLSHIQKKLY